MEATKMKIRFIEEDEHSNILMETRNSDWLSAMFNQFTQIHIKQKKEILICEYNYNILKILENEMDIFVTITDSEKIEEPTSEELKIKEDKKKLMKTNIFEEFQADKQKPKSMKELMKKNIYLKIINNAKN